MKATARLVDSAVSGMGPLSIPILGLLILAGHLLLPDWRIEVLIGLAAVAYIPFMVPVFRYSRVLWIYFERWANPNF